MLNIDQRAGHLNDTLFSTQIEPENEELQLGYEIGSMLELMMSDSASKQDRTDVARGFVLAFSGEARAGIGEDRITALEFAKLLAEKHPPQARTTTEGINNMREAVGIEEQVEDAIPNAFRQQGIKPSPYLLNIIEEKAEMTTDQHSASNPEENVNVTFYTTSVSTTEAESLVGDFLQSHPTIKIFSDLYEPLVEDIHLIDTMKCQGTPLMGIVHCLWKAEKRCSDSNINIKIDTNTSLPHTVHALHCLSQGHNDELWTDQPVVVESSDKWELTNYGSLISYLLLEVEKDMVGTELQNYIDNSNIPPEFIPSLIFNTKLIDLLHQTVVSPATVDPRFVNLMEEMYKNSSSCEDWRNRVTTMSSQDQ
jgi:hypothetical protein